MHPCVHSSTICDNQDTEIADECIKMMWYIYTMELAIKRRKPAIFSHMDELRDDLIKQSK